MPENTPSEDRFLSVEVHWFDGTIESFPGGTVNLHRLLVRGRGAYALDTDAEAGDRTGAADDGVL